MAASDAGGEFQGVDCILDFKRQLGQCLRLKLAP